MCFKKSLCVFLISVVFISCGKDNLVELESVISFTLTVNSGTGGSVSSPGGSYNQGKSVSITATPNSEYVFVNWSNGSTQNPLSITVNSNQNITANFEKRKYPLTITIVGSGTVSEEIISAGKTTTEYTSGSSVQLTATAVEGWEFTGWTGSENSSDNPLQISITTSKNITVTFDVPVVLFLNRTPSHSTINSKIGNIKNNYYHPGHILTPEFIYNTIDIRENCDCTGCNCQVKFNLNNNTSRYFDYNNDGRLDFFAFLANNSNGYSVGFGKYVLVDDILNSPEVSSFDSDIWFGGRMEINDFNGDGTDDILVYHSNDHDNGSGGFYSNRSPLEILYFQQDGSFRTVQVGPDTSLHELASFDIDNDGDIDIVNAEWWMNGQGHVEVPLFYINDGFGNFTVNDTDFLQASFYKEAGIDYAFTGVDAFDLDNDGFIDLLISGETESEINYCIYDNPDNPFEQNCYTTDFHESIRIFWGSDSATFSEDNSTRLPLPFFVNGNEKLSYGMNFVDLNGDGNYDIINNGTNTPVDGNYGPNSGGYIELYQNNGNRQFTNITKETIDVSEWDYANRRFVDTGDIPLFYDMGVVDVDDDGDFDFIPHTINMGHLLSKSTDGGVDSFNWQTNIGKNFHWRNDGGSFTLVNDRTNYKN